MNQAVTSSRDLIELLSASLGREKATSLVHAEREALGIREQDVDHQRALDMLESLAAKPGLEGITARFVKSRLLLAAG